MRRSIQLATLCYIQSKGKTLMLLRNKKKNDVHEGKWNGLGGKLNLGETPERGIIREVQEESGLKITDPHLQGIMTFPLFTPHTDWIVFLFTAPTFSGRLQNSSEGQLKWIENKNLMSLHLWEGDRIFLDWMKKKKYFAAQFVYRKKKLQSFEVSFF